MSAPGAEHGNSVISSAPGLCLTLILKLEIDKLWDIVVEKILH